jgi:hypothetical protein
MKDVLYVKRQGLAGICQPYSDVKTTIYLERKI